MKKVLILGAGMVAKPIIRHLLDNEIMVTVAALNFEEALQIVDHHPNGKAVHWTVDDVSLLDAMIIENDVVVSLLPYAFHVIIAEHCLKHKKNMVTTSYVKPEMQALNKLAKDAGIIILNECGLDPGIDHMSAMRIIDTVHSKGGKVEEFYSICGALPAPEAASNPFRYKFSWSPKGVVMAGNNDAKYLKNGNEIDIPTKDLFKNPVDVNFPEVGKLQIYPNRDSLSYIETYGIPEVKTMMRGTFRYVGWCEALDLMKFIGLISYDKINMKGMTFAAMVASLIGSSDSANIRIKVAEYAKIDYNSNALEAIEWLGLFNNSPMQRGEDSPFEVTSDLMIEKMMLGGEERDMVAMQHSFIASYPDGTKEAIRSRMLDFGSKKTDTAIARTVALPAAVAVMMILKGSITMTGVHIPILPEIYNPILDELEKMNIKMTEEYGLPISEHISC